MIGFPSASVIIPRDPKSKDMGKSLDCHDMWEERSFRGTEDYFCSIKLLRKWRQVAKELSPVLVLENFSKNVLTFLRGAVMNY